jgi:hypothetical protein
MQTGCRSSDVEILGWVSRRMRGMSLLYNRYSSHSMDTMEKLRILPEESQYDPACACGTEIDEGHADRFNS